MAAQLKPAVRDKILLPAFARGVKDPFVATRLAGLRATAACHQHFRAEEVCATNAWLNLDLFGNVPIFFFFTIFVFSKWFGGAPRLVASYLPSMLVPDIGSALLPLVCLDCFAFAEPRARVSGGGKTEEKKSVLSL